MAAESVSVDQHEQRALELHVAEHGGLVEGRQLLDVEVDSAGEVGGLGAKGEEVRGQHVLHFAREGGRGPGHREAQRGREHVPAREKAQQLQRVLQGVFFQDLELGRDFGEQSRVGLELQVGLQLVAVEAQDEGELLLREEARDLMQEEVQAQSVFRAEGGRGGLALELEEVEPGQRT